MAKKRQQKRIKLQKRLAQVQAKEDANAILREAVAALRRGGTERVLSLAGEGLKLARTTADAEAAKALMVEAHVRAGANKAGEARLEHFERALEIEPESARLHFYRGLCLWQLGHAEEALGDLEFAEEEPQARLFASLARLALGRGVRNSEELGAAEGNTLKLVASILTAAPLAELPTPLLGGAQAEALWRALYEMARDSEAAPLRELAELANRTPNLAIKRFAQYYLGVAALRAGDHASAETAWRAAEGAGPTPLKLADNLTALRRERALELAGAGRYEALTETQGAREDQVEKETLALAYEHQGFAAAQAGDWRKAVHDWREAQALRPRRELAQNLALAEEAREHWSEAAEAWRAMLKRRPRKADHPDYLSDTQVAAIWRHAGQCYLRDDDLDEAIRCFKQALKYSEDDTELRFELAETLHQNDQLEAAENELERLLAIDPAHKEALTHLAAMFENSWRKDAIPLWRRALALEPESGEIRDALAQAYLQQARFLPRGEARKRYEEGLKDVPEHPALLLALALSYEGRKKPLVRELLTRAYRASAGEVGVTGLLLRELAHLGAEDLFAEIVAEQRQRSDLLPAFWLDNGEGVFQRLGKRGSVWAERLFDEGIALAERAQAAPELAEMEASKASALAFAFEAALLADDERLVDHYHARIEAEVPESGALEYIEAFKRFRLHEGKEEEKEVRRLLKEAERKARRARDKGMLATVESASEQLEYGPRLSGDAHKLLERLRSALNV